VPHFALVVLGFSLHFGLQVKNPDGTALGQSTIVAKTHGVEGAALSDAEMRARVVDLVFGGEPARLEEFCRVIGGMLPASTSAVLRGSAVTGVRWKDGVPFDADGPGTSDIDLTLVGSDLLGLYSLDGFYVPGVHSKPLSEKAPDIAPALVPLRARLMAMVGRPVNIQVTRDIVMFLRGDLLGQPYLTLVGKAEV
jgi:hypothetical protein